MYHIIIYLIFSQILLSNTIDITESKLNKLAKSPVWLQMLFYENDKSVILNKDYFLTKDGNIKPKNELKETIRAFYSKWENDPNKHPVCRYPARYYWLSTKIKLENYQIINSKCTNLKTWSKKYTNKEISFVFAGSYLGNPGSIFGHSFINIKTNNDNNLFDLAIGYSADIPEDDNIVLYLYKGVFGGYDGTFSDKFYYTKELAYSNVEFRDIWEYELNLSTYQKTLLTLHIWEIARRKSPYFFSNKNCAYQIAKMLEIVVEQEIVSSSVWWYPPIDTFHKLKELKSLNGSSLVKNITLHPSFERQIYNEYSLLSSMEQGIVSDVINNDKEILISNMDILDIDQKINTINFIISYYRYSLVKDPENIKLSKYKRYYLIERLKLKPKKMIAKKHINKSSPDKDNKPAQIITGVRYTPNNQLYPIIGMSIFAMDAVGQNHLYGDEFVWLNLMLGIKDDNIFLDKIDFIKIRKSQIYHLPFKNEDTFSWNLSVGMSQIDLEYYAFLQSGLGKSWKIGNKLLLHSMIDVSLKSKENYFTLSPNIGLLFGIGELKTLLSLGVKENFTKEKIYPYIQIDNEYKLFKNSSISLKYNNINKENITLQMKWFF